MNRSSLSLLLLLFFLASNPSVAASFCLAGKFENEVRAVCSLYNETIFRTEPAFARSREGCVCFYRAYFGAVERVEKFEADSSALEKEFAQISNQADVGLANRSEAATAEINRKVANLNNAFASDLEVAIVEMKAQTENYLLSINQLNMVSLNNLSPEANCRSRPESNVPALWSMSIKQKAFEDLQATRKNLPISDFRKLRGRAKSQAIDAAQTSSIAKKYKSGLKDLNKSAPQGNLPELTTPSPYHYGTRVGALAAGLTAGHYLKQWGKFVRTGTGVASLAAATAVDYFMNKKMDHGTLLTIGLGALAQRFVGTIPGLVFSVTLGGLHIANHNKKITYSLYLQFSKSKIEQNRSITARELSLEWGKKNNLKCI